MIKYLKKRERDFCNDSGRLDLSPLPPFFVRTEHRSVSGGKNSNRGGEGNSRSAMRSLSSVLASDGTSYLGIITPRRGKQRGEKIKPHSQPTRGAVGPRVTKKAGRMLARKKTRKGPTRHPRNSHPFSGAP